MSVWPAKTNVRAPGVLLRRMAQRFWTRKLSGPQSILSQAKPRGTSRAPISSRHPASSGVTEGRAINCSASWSVRDIRKAGDQSRSKSFNEVFCRVCASTRLTITAQ